MFDLPPDSKLLGLTAQIVSAHVANNSVPPEALPELITSVHHTLTGVCAVPAVAEPSEPAVPIKKSVFPGHIVCLECGRSLSMLKGHLKAAHGMTPHQYRAKWGLPASYPTVAPDYAARRSVVAKSLGLGRGRGSPRSIPAASSEEMAVTELTPPIDAAKAKKQAVRKKPSPSKKTA